MKNKEIKALNIDELKQRLISEKETLQRMKFAHAISPIENPMNIKNARRLIAKIKTEIRAREISTSK